MSFLKKLEQKYHVMATSTVVGKPEIDDYNGLWSRFSTKFPKIAKALIAGDMADRFFSGINSVSTLTAGGKPFLFIETPGHGWIVNMKGEVVGEEDDGFDDKSLNTNIDSIFKNMKSIMS